MQESKVWTWVVGAALLAISIAQGSRDVGDGSDQATASDLLRNPGKQGASIARRRTESPWAVFRANWTAVLWRVYRKMNENRLLAVAAGVVFYGLLALFPAVTAFVSLYGLVADPSTIREHLSLVAGVLPQGALDIVNEQLLRLTAHRTSALSLGFIGGLLFALWSANAGSKAIMDGLNVAYGETEKRGFVLLNLVARFHPGRDHRAHAGSERSGDRSDRALAF
jgi:membrane protein